MFSIKSVRAKTLLWALIPTALVLVVVAIIALYAYERVARDVVQQRDTELARVSAARLSEALSRYTRVLQSTADEDDVQSMEVDRLSSALEQAHNQLYVFDAGVVAYNSEGVAVWSHPFGAERQGTDFPVTPEFDKVRRTLRPTFSNVLRDAISGDDVILLVAPIVGSGGEFRGVMAGMFKMKYPLLGPIYAEVLELKAGRSGYAYLVDGNGKIIYHPDGSQVGRNLAATVPVMRATRGEAGAVLTEDLRGESVISGFAPVPDTAWGLITQERWGDIVGPIRGYSRLLLGLWVAGGIISGALVFFAIGRVLRPIRDLTRGARRIAGGDFDHAIAANTGDEIQSLAQQFNAMASALKESYADLEHRVAARTEALRQAEEKYRNIFEKAIEGMYQSAPDGRIITANPAMAYMFGYASPEELLTTVTDVKHQLFIEPGRRAEEMHLLEKHGAVSGFEFQAYRKDGSVIWVSDTARAVRDQSGALLYYEGAIEDITDRKRTEEALIQQTRGLAVVEERNRLARDLHDAVTQTLFSASLIAEVLPRLWERHPVEGQQRLEELRQLTRGALAEMRMLLLELRPAALTEVGLGDLLRQLTEAITGGARVPVTYTVDGQRTLSPDVQVALYRIAQEALNNVAKHAGATQATVSLRYQPEQVELLIRDDGRGFDQESISPQHLGLGIMRERAEAIGATLRIESQVGHGTQVVVVWTDTLRKE